MNHRSPLNNKKTVMAALVLHEARARINERSMGGVWILLEPVCHLLLFTLLFAQKQGETVMGIDFSMFVLVGLLPFLLFRNIALRLMGRPGTNRALFANQQINPMAILIARALVETFFAIAVYILFVLVFAWCGFDVSIKAPLEWLLFIIVGLLFSFGLGVLLAMVGNARPGNNACIRMMFFPLYFISGVLVPAVYLPHAILPLLLLNPFLHLEELIRSQVFSDYEPVEGVSVAYVMVMTLVLLFVSLSAYRHRQQSPV
ncbi:ABC transporter permease [Pseudomonas sp. CLCA07]